MLATTTDLRRARDIAHNVPADRIEPYIEQVENLMVIPLIGAELFETLVHQREQGTLTPENELLLNGGFYDKSHLAGLLTAIAYLAYSKAILNNNIAFTAYGVRQKNGDFSTEIDEKTLTRASNEAREVGLHYLEEVRVYGAARGLFCHSNSTARHRRLTVIEK